MVSDNRRTSPHAGSGHQSLAPFQGIQGHQPLNGIIVLTENNAMILILRWNEGKLRVETSPRTSLVTILLQQLSRTWTRQISLPQPHSLPNSRYWVRNRQTILPPFLGLQNLRGIKGRKFGGVGILGDPSRLFSPYLPMSLACLILQDPGRSPEARTARCSPPGG